MAGMQSVNVERAEEAEAADNCGLNTLLARGDGSNYRKVSSFWRVPV